MKKTIGLIIMLIVMLVSLTGCAQVNYEVEINKDGSGEITYVYGVSKEKIGNATDIVEQFVETMKEQAKEGGYTVEIYENDEISGFKANKYVTDLTTDFSLEEAFGEEYIKDTENNGIKIEKDTFTTKYSQSAELDLTNLSQEEKELTMTYQIKLPHKVKTTNADEISEDGKTLKWKLTGGEVNKIEFEAQEINVQPIAIIIVVIAVAAAAIIYVILKKKM